MSRVQTCVCASVCVRVCEGARQRERVYETLIVPSPIDFSCSAVAGREAVLPQ